MHRDRIADGGAGPRPGDVVRLEAAAVRGEYLEPDGTRLPRFAVPGPYRVDAVRGETVVLVSVLTGDRFETTAAALAGGG